MKIGLLLPSILMSEKYNNRIFAPKDLFLSLSDGLVKKGHEVFVYSAEGTKTSAKLILGDKHLEFDSLRSVKDVAANLQEEMSFIRTSYEYELELTGRAVFHANKNNLDVLHSYMGYLTNYFVSQSNVPVVFTLHDPVFPVNTLEYLRFILFPNHNYIAISRSQKRNYEEALKINPVATVYHGLEIQDFTFSEKQGDYLSFVGRYLPEKGVDDAIKASLALKMQLKMASSSNYKDTEYYREKIKPYLNPAGIEEVPFISTNKEKSEFYKVSKALLFPIKWEEPFGMVMIEAMSCGTPVIAYNRGSVSEIVRDGVTGFVIDQDDEDRLGKGSWVIKKKGVEGLVEAAQRIGEINRNACRRHVEDNFSVEKNVESYEKVYQTILAS